MICAPTFSTQSRSDYAAILRPPGPTVVRHLRTLEQEGALSARRTEASVISRHYRITHYDQALRDERGV